MKVYVVICKDRHEDDEIKLFLVKETALKYAKGLYNDKVYNSGWDRKDDATEEYNLDEEHLYRAVYSSEGDSIDVKCLTVNQE